MPRVVLYLSIVWLGSACPFLKQMNIKGPVSNPHGAAKQAEPRRLQTATYDVAAVKEAIKGVLASDDADGGPTYFTETPANGNYGPNLIRLAWHCAGTYNIAGGWGGCDGARIRFSPEKDWEDNAGLVNPDANGRNAIIDVLQPVFAAHSASGLTWADLIVLAGNVAIEEMGGPQDIAFCPGQTDAADGSETALYHDGNELIYVNAGKATAADVRDNFTKMGMTDRETVALIAGGHTFGRAHLATSGFDGAWTQTPSTWSNLYVTNLLDMTWEPHATISGQFKPADGTVSADGNPIMMLQADVALIDDAAYLAVLNDYKANPDKLKTEFGAAWYKLMRGGRNTICDPKPVTYTYDKCAVEAAIAAVLASDDADGGANFFTDANAGGNYGPNLIRLAWHCAGTYRTSDHVGGCEGAKIRHVPEKDWPDNAGLINTDEDNRPATIGVLQSVYDQFSAEGLTWADLIVLAGNVAIQQMGGPVAPFCGGRVDAADGSGSAALENRMFNNGLIYVNAGVATAADIRDNFTLMGMTDRETVALIAGGHTFGRCHTGRSGFDGAWTQTPSTWSNLYVTNLLDMSWEPHATISGQFKPADGATSPDGAPLLMLTADLALKADAAYEAVLQDYKTNPNKLKEEFGPAWAKLMNGGRVDACAATGASSSATCAPTSAPTASNSTAGGGTTGSNDDASIASSKGYLVGIVFAVLSQTVIGQTTHQ